MDVQTKEMLKKLDKWVKEKSLKEKSGHDYSHAKRVEKIALNLAKDFKNIDYEVLIASCLIHDTYEKNKTPKILKNLGFEKEKIQKINKIVIQFRHIGKKPKEKFVKSIESEIFLDADNLDAMGSIGISRAIAFGTSRGFPLFKSKDDSLNDSIYGTIKEIIKWKDSMHTKEAKKMAKKRMRIMKKFLQNMEKEFG